jgi:hypothetical protein
MSGQGQGMGVAPGYGQPLNIQQADPRANGIRSFGTPQLPGRMNVAPGYGQQLNMPAGMVRPNGLHAMQQPMMQPRTGGGEPMPNQMPGQAGIDRPQYQMPPGLLELMQSRQPPRQWQDVSYGNQGGGEGGGGGGY